MTTGDITVSRNGVATQQNDMGSVTYGPYSKRITTALKDQVISDTPVENVTNGGVTNDVRGNVMNNTETWATTCDGHFLMCLNGNPTGELARGKNSTNAGLASMLLQLGDITLKEKPHEDTRKLAERAQSSNSSKLNFPCPFSESVLSDFGKKAASFFQQTNAANQAFVEQQATRLQVEMVVKNNLKVRNKLIDIFQDEALVNARWGAQLASTDIMYEIVREDPELTNAKIINEYVSTNDARMTYSRPLDRNPSV